MSLLEEINKRKQLPKPRTPAQFETIDTSSDETTSSSSPSMINYKSKNPKLYDPDPQNFRRYDGNADTDNCPNEFEITSSILEINGGDCHSNKAIEKRWKARVNEKQSQQKEIINDEIEIHNENDNVSMEKSREQITQNCQYKNNILMRNILEKKMASLNVTTSISSSFDGGKTINNNHPINVAMLTSNPDDPDIFFLRNTSEITKFYDDGFRFKHRGIKKKITPRQYAIYEIKDDDFIFKKKS